MLDGVVEAVEGGWGGEEGLHAEEVGVEDGGEGELVDDYFCGEREEGGGVVERVAEVDEPIFFVSAQSSPKSKVKVQVPVCSLQSLHPVSPKCTRKRSHSPSITRNRRPCPNNQSPPSPLRFIVSPPYPLRTQIPQEIHNQRAYELRRPGPRALRPAEE